MPSLATPRILVCSMDMLLPGVVVPAGCGEVWVVCGVGGVGLCTYVCTCICVCENVCLCTYTCVLRIPVYSPQHPPQHTANATNMPARTPNALVTT